MKSSVLVASFFILILTVLPAFAAKSGQGTKPTPITPQAKQSVTQGSVTVEGKRISYNAIAGIAILKNYKGQPYTSMSYVAYIKKGVNNESDRPITFFWNGGPGSATVWLQMLAWGPKLVVVPNAKMTPPAPYKLENNDDSLLDATDEVFIDAPATGFGRIITKKEGGVGTPKMVFGVDQDAKAFARFITQYLTQHSRWNSPKFIYGESYGTTRAAVLSADLERVNANVNGVILQSSILSFDINVEDDPKANPGVNVSYATALPSYAAAAWYHHKLPNQPKELQPFLKKVEHFAMNDYLLALDQGNTISTAHKQQIAETIHQYTGLPVAYIIKGDLKVTGGQFSHELLSDEGDVTGQLDARYSGPALNLMSESTRYGPVMSAIGAPTVGLFNDYVRDILNFGKGKHYRTGVPGQIFSWSMKHNGRSRTLNVMTDLATAMKRDPDLKVLLAGGYMDLVTPFYSAIYEMHQLPIPEKLQHNISYAFFASGHMVYLNPKAHKGLHDAVSKFIAASYARR